MNTGHHAILVRNNAVQTVKVSELKVSTDVQDTYFDSFGIGDARDLVVRAHGRPVTSNELLLVVRTHFITHEAQNALLKVLEEPPASTKFIFVVPPDFAFLETLQSRFYSETIDHKIEDKKLSVEFTDFVHSGYAERIAAIDKAAKKKDIQWQQIIKSSLIIAIKNRDIPVASLAELEYVSRTLLTRGASNKMLLEHLALTLDTRSG